MDPSLTIYKKKLYIITKAPIEITLKHHIRFKSSPKIYIRQWIVLEESSPRTEFPILFSITKS